MWKHIEFEVDAQQEAYVQKVSEDRQEGTCHTGKLAEINHVNEIDGIIISEPDDLT